MDRSHLWLLPKDIHITKRVNDICAAIVRRYTTNWPIPIEWIEEYNDLITEGYFTEIREGALK